MLHRYLPKFLGVVFITALFQPSDGWTDVFSVSGVAVDAAADDDVTAKEKGLATAKQEALQRLFRRLSLRSDFDRLPDVKSEDIVPLLRDFSVESEKFGGGRYIASLTVRFRPDRVRTFLRTAKIPFAETASRPIIVLPVFKRLGSTLLWDDPNPWFLAWSQIKLPDGLLPLILPVGDLSDVTVISAEQAEKRNTVKLQEVADKYKAAGIVVAIAQWRKESLSGKVSLDVTQVSFRTGFDSQTALRQFNATADEEEQGLLRRSALAIASDLEEGWKSVNLLTADSKQSLDVSASLPDFQHWLTLQRKLANVSALRNVRLNSLSIKKADMTLDFVGNSSQLKVALAQQDINLVFASGSWQLQLRDNR